MPDRAIILHAAPDSSIATRILTGGTEALLGQS